MSLKKWNWLGHTRNKRDSMSDSGGSDIIDLEEGTILLDPSPLTTKKQHQQNCSSRYNNNISNTNVFTVETDVWFSLSAVICNKSSSAILDWILLRGKKKAISGAVMLTVCFIIISATTTYQKTIIISVPMPSMHKNWRGWKKKKKKRKAPSLYIPFFLFSLYFSHMKIPVILLGRIRRKHFFFFF